MGRETHLIEVEWEREPYWWKEKKYLWPVAAPSTGRVERTSPLPFTDSQHSPSLTLRDDFEQSELGLAWTFRRAPEADAYSLNSRPGFLRLYSQSTTPAARGRVAQVGIKQTESDFLFTARTHFESQTMNSEAGVTLFQKDDHFTQCGGEKAGDRLRAYYHACQSRRAGNACLKGCSRVLRCY